MNHFRFSFALHYGGYPPLQEEEIASSSPLKGAPPPRALAFSAAARKSGRLSIWMEVFMAERFID
jgi:hypothetical protein